MNLSNCYVVQQVRTINIYIRAFVSESRTVTELISISFALYCLTRGAVTPSGASTLGQKHFTERQCSFSISSSASVAQFECVLFSYSAHNRTMHGSISIILPSVAMTSMITIFTCQGWMQICELLTFTPFSSFLGY